MNLEHPSSADMSAVLPYGVKRRCVASYQLTAPLHGWIGTGYEDYRIPEGAGVGFYEVRKAYLTSRTKINRLVGVITSYSIHYTKLYDLRNRGGLRP